MTGAAAERCPACGLDPRPRLRPWIRRCTGCGLWSSDLRPDRGERSDHVSEGKREAALEPLRKANFETILDLLARGRSLRGARLLEVGSAHGWFLAGAAARGMDVLGIEPDAEVAARAQTGLPVRIGYFPDAVRAGEAFDLIAFNDVFEHLPEPSRIADACVRLLRPGGRLVLNLPDADGALFRTACVLARAGISAPLERLWQARFRFPHLWYFDARSLQRLLAPHPLRLVASSGLPILRRGGLWSRLRMDRTTGPLTSAVVYAALWSVEPLLRRAPDILLQVYERGPED